MDHINMHCLSFVQPFFSGSFWLQQFVISGCHNESKWRGHSSRVPHCSHEKMWLSNYWRITIIYVWKRNLPLAFVAQHEMNPVQLSHFVSLRDCSLALSTPVASARRPAPLQVLIIASVPLVTAQSPGVWGHEGSTPNDVIRLLELLLQVSKLSQLRSLLQSASRAALSSFCSIKPGDAHTTKGGLTYMCRICNQLVSVPHR